jgi:hypothetical protein
MLAVAAALVTSVAVLPASVGAQPAGRCGDDAVLRLGDWEVIRGFEFPDRPPPASTNDLAAGLQEIAAFAVDPVQPQRLHITNNTTVLRSEDGGCEWKEIYSLPDAVAGEAPSARTALITSITRLQPPPTTAST